MTIPKTTRSDNFNHQFNKSFVLKPLVALVIGACCAFGAQAQNAAATGSTVGIWTPAAGLPMGLSRDGTTQYGSARYDTGYTAVFGPPGTPSTTVYGDEAYIIKNGTTTRLGFISNVLNPSAYSFNRSYASGTSANGDVVVGSSTCQLPGGVGNCVSGQAFRWESGVMTGLGFLGTGRTSYASGVSADGSVVVGSSHMTQASDLDPNQVWQAFRWQNGTMTGLGYLGSGNQSRALAVSADGNVVVGESNMATAPSYNNGTNNPVQAFRWQGGAMTGLGYLAGHNNSSATVVSADGSVVGGTSYDSTGTVVGKGFRWTSSGGMASVASWLTSANIVIPTGWNFSNVTRMSADGNTLAGFVSLPSGAYDQWLARVAPTPTPTPTPAPVLTPGSGFLPSVQAFNNTVLESGSRAGQSGMDLTNLAMFGAHHRSLLDNGLVKTKSDGTCAWSTADATRSSNDTNMQLFEIGACKDIGNTRIGVGVGQDMAKQDWQLGGSAKFSGQHLVAEVAHQFEHGQSGDLFGRVEASMLGYYGSYNTEFNRHYTNGVSIDESNAKSKAQSYGLRVRGELKEAVKVGSFVISPYAQYAYVHTKLDGYTESKGGFDVRYNAAAWDTNDLRLGAAAKMAMNAATDLRLGLELVHRFESNTSGVNGDVVGLYDFSAPSEKVKQDWARLTVDVDHRISEDATFTLGANAASKGGDASWGVTAGLRVRF